jgi:hypothetical protein
MLVCFDLSILSRGLIFPGLVKNVRAQEDGKTTVKEESGIYATKEGDTPKMTYFG